MRMMLTAAAMMMSVAGAYADDDARHARALCATMDATGLASAPCQVSAWNSAVIATIDMVSSEARDLCHRISEYTRQKNIRFSPGWTLQIRSPYSGENSIAFCNLPN